MMIFQSTLRRTERQGKIIITDCTPWISIHAPTNGATLTGAPIASPIAYFNPRSDERSDGIGGNVMSKALISIHAPTNGATLIRYVFHRPCVFQSTLRRTERRITVLSAISVSVFQSTLRRTERRIYP